MGFCQLDNNAASLGPTKGLAAPRAALAATFTLVAGEGAQFGAPTSTNPLRVTLVKQGHEADNTRANRRVFLCTGITGDVLTAAIATDEGAWNVDDTAFAVGDSVLANVTAGMLGELQTQVNTNTGNITTNTASITSLNAAAEKLVNKGAANGYAGLDSGAHVPLAQLPSLPESQVTNLTTDLGACEKTANKAVANGYASLDATTKIPVAQIPAIAESGVTNLVADLAATEKTANKGVANGYASLDGTGKVPTAQLPASVVGALEYQGTWDASLNSPALASGVGTKGFYYKVSVAGSTSIDGNASWHVGDWIVFNGTTWDKIDNFEAVTSVAGKTGAVTLAEADVTNLTTDLATINTNISTNTTRITSLRATWISLKDRGIDDGADIETLGSQTFGAGDQTTAIQALLDLATNGPVNILWDVRCTAGNLKIRSNTNIQGVPGCGVIAPNNLNTAIFKNFTTTLGTGAPVASGNGTPMQPGNYGNKNIRIAGLIINGNGLPAHQNNAGADFGVTASPGNGNQYPLNAIRFWGVQNPLLEDLKILAYGGYGIWIVNADVAKLDRVHADYTGAGDSWGLGTDPFHFNGPINVIDGQRLRLKGGDDGIAINADEGSGTDGTTFPTAGVINWFTFRDIWADSHAFALFRLLSVASPVAGEIENVYGSARGLLHATIFPGTRLTGTGAIKDVRFKGVRLTCNGNPQENGFVYINQVAGSLLLKNFYRENWAAASLPSVNLDISANVARLVMDEYVVNDTSNAYIGVMSKGFAKQISFVDPVVTAPAGAPPLFKQLYNDSGNGTVTDGFGQLLIANANVNGPDYIADFQHQRSGSEVTAVGILHTGGTRSGSFNNDGVIDKFVLSAYNGPGLSTSAPTPIVGTQNPAVWAGDAFANATAPAALDYLLLSADANTYADSGFVTPQSTNGGAVLGLKDLIGASPGIYAATTSAGHSPTLLTGAQNALNGLLFDGTTSRMALARHMDWPAFTILLAFIPKNVTAEGTLVGNFQTDVSANQYGWLIEQNHVAGKATFYTANVGTQAHHDFGTLALNTPTIIAATWDGANVTTYQGSAGVLTLQTGPTAAALSYAGPTSCAPTLGALASGAGFGNFANAVILEVEAFPGTDATTRNSRYTTMKTKWSITG